MVRRGDIRRWLSSTLVVPPPTPLTVHDTVPYVHYAHIGRMYAHEMTKRVFVALGYV